MRIAGADSKLKCLYAVRASVFGPMLMGSSIANMLSRQLRLSSSNPRLSEVPIMPPIVAPVPQVGNSNAILLELTETLLSPQEPWVEAGSGGEDQSYMCYDPSL